MQIRRTFFHNFIYFIPFTIILQVKFYLEVYFGNIVARIGSINGKIKQNAVMPRLYSQNRGQESPFWFLEGGLPGMYFYNI